MVHEILKIRTDKGLGDKDPLFKDIEITEYSYKGSRMGMPELTATLMWGTCLDEEWTRKEYAMLNGERFYIRHTPSSSKSNTDARYKHDIAFTSEFAELLGNTYFVDAVPDEKSGIVCQTKNKPCTNNTTFTFYGTISEFLDRLNCAFLYAGIGDSILKKKTSVTTEDNVVGDGYVAMLDPDGDYDKDKSYEFSFEDKKLWEVMTEGYNITEIPFERRGRKIIFGAVPKVVEHKFEYGHDNELLSINKNNANAQVINRISMLGSTENIPYYYPNETEYGNIGLIFKEGNKKLSKSTLNVVNRTQLLSKLTPDTYAVIAKVDKGNKNGMRPTSVKTAFGSDKDYNLEDYSWGKELKNYDPASPLVKKYLHVEFEFAVSQSGEYVIDRIEGGSWRQDTSSPSKDKDMILTGFTPVHLTKLDDNNVQTILDSNLSTTGYGGSIKFGYLLKGRYKAHMMLGIINKSGANGTTPVASFYRISAINVINIREANTKEYEYCWDIGDGKTMNIGELGVKVDAVVDDSMVGEGFGWTAEERMPFQDRLMPSIYRKTLGAERFYNALNNTYADPETGEKYVFPNPYIEGAPSEYIFRDDDRKPTIEGITNANGKLFGEIVDIAYDSDDNDSLKPEATEENDKNDTLKYEHSFFYIKLNVFNGEYGFDLFSSASQTDAMTLQMISGNCNGCKFKIQALEYEDATGLKTYKNPVQTTGANGDIIGGSYEDKVKESWQSWQQDTQTHSIWICVQKDAETFGVILPNQSHSFKPKIGDKFNIINIDLPQPYIEYAEKKLEEDGIRFMAENNEEKFTFDISASRIFFAENPDVLAQLDEYSKIKVIYNGKAYEQYVNQFSIDCKDSEALPNIGIALTDTLSVGQSFVDQVAEKASSLVSNPNRGVSEGQSGMTIAEADQRYLNKTQEDRTSYKLSSDTGFEVGEFVSGSQGGIFYRDPETGQTYIEADKLKIRMKAIFEELEIAKVSTIGGKFIITPGGGINISYVEELADSYRCYFKAKDDEKGAECRFVVGDQVQCHEFNVQDGIYENASNRYYWRLVTAVNNEESYIELSKADCDNAFMKSDAPAIGDTIVQLGNRTDKTRQSAIILSTVDAFAPCVTLYNGIDSYSLDGKAVVEYGVDKTKNPPRPFFHCYGDMYVGAKDGSRFLQYTPEGGLIVRGSISSVSTIVDEYGNEVQIDKYVEDSAQSAAEQAKAELQGKIEELQKQVDGVVETWNGNVDPTKTNYPASGWTADADIQAHIGDVYFNIGAYDVQKNPNAGHAWRWYYNSNTDYGWVEIADSDAVRALQLAQMSVLDADVLYIQTDSQTTKPQLPTVNSSGAIANPNGWTTTAPEWKDGMYMWQTTYVKKGDGSATFSDPTCISGARGQQGLQGLQGDKGEQGIPGKNGEDGKTSYFHIKYSSVANPTTSAQMTEMPSTYIGTYVDYTEADSNDPKKYTWSRFEGMQGEDGSQGIPGKNGEDGKTSYLHIKYSNDGGKTFTPASGNLAIGETPGDYIGQYTDFTQADSTKVSDYKWAKIKGESGANGTSITITSQSVKYSTVHTATQPADNTFTLSTVPTLSAGQYLWSMTTVNYSNGQSTKSYAVSRIGTNGQDGANGTSVTIASTSVKYAKTSNTTQPADNAFTATSIGAVGLKDGDYLWVKTEVTYSDGSNTKSYSVSRIGSDGDDGLPGSPGADGKTTYVHFAYASGVTGNLPHPTSVSGFSTTAFDGAKYIGVCTDFNQADPTANPQTTYEWSEYRGKDGNNAKSVTINGEQVFAYTDNFTSVATPTSITLTATLQNTTGYKWTYKREGDTSFRDVSGGTTSTCVVSANNTSYFPNGAKSCVLRCTSGDVYDEITIVKVSSGSNGTNGANGKDGEDGYTVILSNENHTFEGDTTKAKASSTTSEIIAYKGATRVNATIGTITGLPSKGMSTSLTSNGTTTAKFTVKVTDALTKDVATSGQLTIPITVDGKTFNRTFSWNLSLAGRGIVSVVEEYAISASSSKAPADSEFSASVPTMTDTKPYLWNREKTTYSDNTSETTTAVVIGVKGQNGADGATVVSVTNYYLASASASGVKTDTAGWVTDASKAVTDASKPYLWNYEVTKWSKGADTSTAPHVVGKFGKDGRTPRITEQYYLSTSSTQLTGGSWQDKKPSWVAGRYYWTRSKIDYGDGDVEYTDGICVTPENGTSVLAEYSADATNWHPSYQSGDVWMHTSTDGGKTWTSAVRIVGSNYSDNLLLNSNFEKGEESWNKWNQPIINEIVELNGKKWAHVKTDAVHWEGYWQARKFVLKPNTKYTLSFLAKGIKSQQLSVMIHWDTSGMVIISQSVVRYDIDTTEKRIVLNLVSPNNADFNTISVMIGNGTDAIATEMWFTDVKLEEGTNPDPQWSPASSEMVGTDGKWRKYQWAKNTSATTAPTSGWQDTPLTASAGEYVWMRSGWVVPPATEPTTWETATRLTGDKGAKGDPGSPTYMLDLTDEVKGIACDASGNPISSSIPTSQAQVWKGSTKLAHSSVTYSIAQATGITASVNNSTGVVTLSNLTADTATAVVQAVVDGVTLQSTISVYKVRPGGSYAPNLILGTKDVSFVASGTSAINTSKKFNVVTNLKNFTAGTKLTLSFDYEYSQVKTQTNANTKRFGFQKPIKQYSNAQSYIEGWVYLPENSTGLSGKGTYHTVMTIPEGADIDVNDAIFYIQVASGYVKMENFKIEEGANENPHWSPASSEMVGESAVSYSIEPSVDNITKSMTGELSATSVTCSVYKTTGNATRVLTSEKTLTCYRVKADGTTQTTILNHSNGTSASQSVTDDTEALIFELTDGSTILDRERVPVLADASDLDLGGRNLILKSGQGVTTASYLAKEFYLAEKPKAGDTYTFTLWGSLASTKSGFHIFNSGGYVKLGELKQVSNGIYQLTFKWINVLSGNTANDTTIRIYAVKSSQSGTSTISKVKLEKGNVGSDWSPAPEDTGTGVNLLRNSRPRHSFSYTTAGDHYTKFPAQKTVYLEQGATYTISARTNSAKFTSVHGTSTENRCVLWLCSGAESPQGTVNQIVSGTDMTTDGSIGQTFVWNNPTGEYCLRVNFYAIGTWWFEKVKIEKGTYATEWTPSPEDVDYLEKALKETTKVEGGLILTSMVSLGQNNTDYSSQTTWSGISGIYDTKATGNGIALWFGGDMLDLADYYNWDNANGKWVSKGGTIPSRIAKGVDRMDGSGYRAGGNFWWDANGNAYYVGNIRANGLFVGEVCIGDKSGQRIELDPAQQAMSVFGVDGGLVATHSGRKLTVNEAQPSTTKGTSGNKAINLGSTTLNISSGTSSSKSVNGIICQASASGSGTLTINIPSLVLNATATGATGNTIQPKASLEVYLVITRNTTVFKYSIGKADSLGSASTVSTNAQKYQIPISKNETFKAELIAECNLTGSTGSTGTLQVSSATISYELVTQAYRCEYGANGWIISIDSKNYAYLIVENGKLNFKVVSNGTTVISS